MGRRRRIASDALMLEAARRAGIEEEKVRSGDLGEATTEQIGLMVKAMIDIGRASLLAKGPETTGIDGEA